MRVYLDNCCYNRPFDEQGQLSVLIETEAKKEIQWQMRAGLVEYVWSFMLSMESSRNPDLQRKFAIGTWVDKGILKKVRMLGMMRVANPVEYVLEGMK